MIPSTFDYVRAESVEDAIRLLQASEGEGKLLAGGHSLIPLMKFRLTTPGKLIDISHLGELKGIRIEDDRLIVGALTTHRELAASPLVREHLPVLADAARQIGDLQVRNRGTVGGNIAHADPSADLPGVALALDAVVEMQGEDGLESVPVSEFFLGPLITALPETSVLKSVSFRIPPKHTKSIYLKYFHPASGYAVIGVCAVVGTDASGVIDYAQIGINGVADIAYRAEAVEQALIGKVASEDVIAEAAALAAEGGEISQDLFASAEYRRHLCTVYVKRALQNILL